MLLLSSINVLLWCYHFRGLKLCLTRNYSFCFCRRGQYSRWLWYDFWLDNTELFALRTKLWGLGLGFYVSAVAMVILVSPPPAVFFFFALFSPFPCPTSSSSFGKRTKWCIGATNWYSVDLLCDLISVHAAIYQINKYIIHKKIHKKKYQSINLKLGS